MAVAKKIHDLVDSVREAETLPELPEDAPPTVRARAYANLALRMNDRLSKIVTILELKYQEDEARAVETQARLDRIEKLLLDLKGKP